MLIYVCSLSVVLCHRRWLVDLIFFNRSYMADTLLRFLRLREGTVFILSIYACFQRFINYIATCGMWRVYGLVMTC